MHIWIPIDLETDLVEVAREDLTHKSQPFTSGIKYCLIPLGIDSQNHAR